MVANPQKPRKSSSVSAHHSAANFGQYVYGVYFPNRAAIAETDMPKTETALLQPSRVRATAVMAVLEALSNHSPDEEYLGRTKEPSWEKDQVINDAFKQICSGVERFGEHYL
ncbi:Lipoxygenase, C-terminal [Dillenia turbinata]|uniref:Lipoxygenase, C-terminal n=1 Tax=Dillenia turbinata TaxID=194707 RepID=A0AAN8ZD35_9MAGN